MARAKRKNFTHPPSPKEIVFHYIKSPQFRTVHADGVHGGITPQGRIQMSVFSERFPIPVQTVQKIMDNQPGEEVVGQRVAKEGVVREVEVNLVMDVRQAASLVKWLEQKISTFNELAKATSPKTQRRRSKGS
ncbi:MAG: hypothetical protein WD768_06125 [Phycisphaeraceae bacterium]